MSHRSKAAIKSNGEAVDHSPMRAFRTAEGQPTLFVIPTSNYTWIWSSRGSGSHADCSIWRPTPRDSSFFIVGDYAHGNYGNPTGPTLIVKALHDKDEDMKLLAEPRDWSQIWDDKGTGERDHGTIWMPVPPDGYVALGFVCWPWRDNWNEKPNIPNYRCVRADFTTKSEAGNWIWDDTGTGAQDGSLSEVSLFQNKGVDGVFVAQGSYKPYDGNVYAFKS